MASYFDELRKERIQREYEELRVLDPDEFRECVERATAIRFNHKLDEVLPDIQLSGLVADIESSLVECALRNRSKGGR